MVSSANVKDNTTNSCKKHFREASTLKTVKIASASFRDCSPVQIFDSYVQILHSEDENIKNRNSCVPGPITSKNVGGKLIPPLIWAIYYKSLTWFKAILGDSLTKPPFGVTSAEVVIIYPALIGNPDNGYLNPYYKVDEFIPTIGKQRELIDPSTCKSTDQGLLISCTKTHPSLQTVDFASQQPNKNSQTAMRFFSLPKHFQLWLVLPSHKLVVMPLRSLVSRSSCIIESLPYSPMSWQTVNRRNGQNFWRFLSSKHSNPMDQHPGSPWPPFLIGWFPNHHYFSRGKNHLPKSNHHFFKMVTTTSREQIWTTTTTTTTAKKKTKANPHDIGKMVEWGMGRVNYPPVN